MMRLASSPDPRPGSAGMHAISGHKLLAEFGVVSLVPEPAPPAPIRPIVPLTTLTTLTASAYAPLHGPLPAIEIDDWNDLFRAVEMRLKAAVGTPLALAGAAVDMKPDDIALKVQRVVLECVTALEQLHTALTHERSLRYQHELEVFDTQIELAQALPENMGTPYTRFRAREQVLPGKSTTQSLDAIR